MVGLGSPRHILLTLAAVPLRAGGASLDYAEVIFNVKLLKVRIMQSGFMQRLRRGLLLALLGAALPASAASEATGTEESQREQGSDAGGKQTSTPISSLSSAEQERYLAELKRLYPRQAPRKALLEHCNRLLESYALRAGYRVGETQANDLLYQLSILGEGTLNVREESRSADGSRVEVHNRPLELYGVDPFVRYDCPSRGPSCQVLSPKDGSPLFTLVRDHAGMEELAKALSFLIRDIQKG